IATPEALNDYRGNQIQDRADFERDQDIRRAGYTDESGKFKVKRPGLKDFATNLALGFMQGAQASPNNALAGGLGGAGTAGVISAINPLAAREYNFAMTRQPGIEAEEEKRRRIEDRAYAGKLEDAKLRGLEADTQMTELKAKNFPEQV